MSITRLSVIAIAAIGLSFTAHSAFSGPTSTPLAQSADAGVTFVKAMKAAKGMRGMRGRGVRHARVRKHGRRGAAAGGPFCMWPLPSPFCLY
ncbi:MAG TPA: hypothetical protein VE986_10850 [Hyphomicrobiales bacterium]|nr:hypothetical protein [Hyphomicrobiales bacterium]